MWVRQGNRRARWLALYLNWVGRWGEGWGHGGASNGVRKGFIYFFKVMRWGCTVFFTFWLCCTVCGILVPRPGIKPMPPALEVQSLYHRTTREVPRRTVKNNYVCVVFTGCHVHSGFCDCFCPYVLLLCVCLLLGESHEKWLTSLRIWIGRWENYTKPEESLQVSLECKELRN